jgi:hypothetical protein
MSNASEVYTRLGLDAVEAWTSLWKRYKVVGSEMGEVTDELERDKLLKELVVLGRSINEIEQDAGIEMSKRTGA